jgi:hypothetical protein
VYVLEVASFHAHPRHAAVLRRRGGRLQDALRRRFPGLRKVQLARVAGSHWLQLGFWDNREAAEAAASQMFDMPEMSDWLAQVDEFADPA